LDNEPLAGVRAIPLYRERYFLFTASTGPFRGRQSVSWREVAETPLCLLTPDMQNRRILNTHFRDVGAERRPSVETNSVLTLCTDLRSLPVIEPDLSHSVGLVVPDREPLTPSARHLVELVSRPDVLSGVDRAV